MVTLDSVLVRAPDLLTADIENDTVIMQVETGTYFSLGEIGSDIWSRLASPIQVRVLCEQLARDYVGAPDAIQTDVIDLLSDLLDRKLIYPA